MEMRQTSSAARAQPDCRDKTLKAQALIYITAKRTSYENRAKPATAMARYTASAHAITMRIK